MSKFASAEVVYETLGRLTQDIVASEGLGRVLRATDSVVQLCIEEPTATITADLRSLGGSVTFGDTSLSPTITLTLSGDTAHRLFLGQTTMVSELTSKQVAVHGDAAHLMAPFLAIQLAASRRYAQILELTGHGELVPALG